MVLMFASLGLLYVSQHYTYGTSALEQPVVLIVLLMMLAGLVVPIWVFIGRRYGPSLKTTSVLSFLFLSGLFLRLIFLGSTPIYEDDWYRYLWDGAIVAEGFNPYLFAPADFLDPLLQTEISPVLLGLSENPLFPERINYPYVTTIYPPVTQGFFALAHFITPLGLTGWRIVLLLSEITAFFLMVKALRLYGQAAFWSALYWINPLVIMTTMNAAHMDALLTPFIMLALIAVYHRKVWMTSFMLILAAGIKIWPLILAPLFLKSTQQNYIKIVFFGAFIGVGALLILSPMLLSLSYESGLIAYSEGWQKNAFLFKAFDASLSGFPELTSRLVVVAFILAITAWLFFTPLKIQLPHACLLLVSSLFFLSPTGYPWYAVWIFMFLPFRPNYGLALLSATLPLYYARYMLAEAGSRDIFENILVPLQFGIPIIVLSIEFYQKYKLKDRAYAV